MEQREFETIFVESELDEQELRDILHTFPLSKVEVIDNEHISGVEFLTSLALLIPSAVIVRAVRDVLLERIRSRTAAEKDSKMVRVHHGDIYYEGPASNLPVILETIFGKKTDAK